MIFKYSQNEETYRQIVEVFEKSYSLKDFRGIKKSLKPFFTKYLSPQTADEEIIHKIQVLYSSSFIPSKRKYSELFALLFSSEENFAVYFSWLPDTIQKVWKAILSKNGISSKELALKYNIYIPDIHLPAFSMKRDSLPYLCFFLSDVYYNTTLDFIEKIGTYYFYLPPKIHSLVIPLFFHKEEYELTPFNRLPPEENLLVYENKQEILGDILLIKGVEQQGYILLNTKKNVTLTTVTTVERKIELTEFFNSVIKEVASLRGYLLLILYTRYKFSGLEADTPEKYIKNIFSNLLPKDFGWIIPPLLHHIRGYRDLYKLINPGATEYNRIVDYIRATPSGKWLGVDNLLLHCNYKAENLLPLPDAYLEKDYLRFRGEIIRKDAYFMIVTVPFVKVILFLLAAFGILDIAYKEYSVSFDSYYESLRYFRLTDFGEYIFGKKQSFTRLEGNKEKHYFEADDKNLIIRSLEPDNIYEKLLIEMAMPISKTRFKVTPISFLKSCKTAVDIENKINFFYLFVCPAPSSIWIEFFESVKKRIKPLTEITNTFKLFKLDPSNTELIRLIAQDPLIKKYVLKVENHHLLIKTQDLNKVIERLKTYGYLL